MREWLSKIREHKGFTQKQVAEKCGISRSSYADMEQGRRNPKVETAKVIANELGFEWTLFFEQNGRKMRPNTKKSA